MSPDDRDILDQVISDPDQFNGLKCALSGKVRKIQILKIITFRTFLSPEKQELVNRTYCDVLYLP